jgi:RimJ/RimL family protein N-acetyltransferase
MIVETQRLRMRPFCDADFDDLFRLFSEPEVMRFIGQGVRTAGETKQRLDAMIAHWNQYGFGLWALIDRIDNRFVGRCGFGYLHDRQDAELAYALMRPYWGQGLASEAAQKAIEVAFEQFHLPRLLAVADVDNLASQRVLRKLGMSPVGHLQIEGHAAVQFVLENPSFNCPPARR